MLQFLLDFGKQIANVSDILMGNPMSAQMPATSVVTLVEQGSKIFSSILSRVYEGLKAEFKILYDLNRKYISFYPQKDLMIKNGFISEATYAMDRYNIYPVANPAMGTDAVRLAKMQVLMERFAGDPDFDAREIKRRFLEAIGVGQIDKLMPPPNPNPQPSPQELLIQSQIELNNAMAHEKMTKMLLEHEREGFQHELDEKRLQADASYKGGLLAIGKGKTMAEVAIAEATAGEINVRKAQVLVDQEAQTSMPPISFDDQLQNALTNQQGMGDTGQNSPQMPEQEQSPSYMGQEHPQSGQGELNFPPELEQMLQGVAQEQQKGQSGQQ
jgi:hypothetical protein